MRYLILFFAACLLTVNAFAQVAAIPNEISYQGVLTTASGTPAADGSYDLQFALFDADTGGTAQWSETQTGVNVSRGAFSVLLGSVTPLPLVFNNQLYVEVSAMAGPGISSPVLFSPRTQLASVPYALGPWLSQNGNVFLKEGNVGIGTTAPTQLLHVQKSLTDNYIKVDAGATTANYSGIMLSEYNINWGWALRHNAGNDNLFISYQDNTPTFTDILTLRRSNGNVGIGTTVPGYKLDVNGSFRTVGGNLTIFNDYIYVSPLNANTLNSAYNTNALADMWVNYRGYSDGFTQFRNFNVGDGKGSNIAWFDAANKRMSINNGQAANNTLSVVGSADISGNVGIGRTSPGAKLDARWGSGVGIFVGDRTPFGTALYETDVTTGTTHAWFAEAGTRVFSVTSGGQGYFSGDVGIGTTSPAGKLHIANTEWNSSPLRITGLSGAVVGPSIEMDATDGTSGQKYSLIATNSGAGAGGGKLAIYHNGPSQFGYRLVIDGSGNVGIGTTAPAAKLHVSGTAGNGTGVWSNLSDRRLKNNIEPMQRALETVERLQGVTFRWKDPDKDTEFGRVRGLIAQDVEKVIPEWVKTDPDGYKHIQPIGVDALLIEAIKELSAKNQSLEARLAEMETKMKELAEKKNVGDKSLGELK